MADAKLSELTELAAAPAVDDELYIRDISEAALAESKRITVANLMKSIMKAGLVTETTSGAGLIEVEFAAEFASTPVVVATLIGDVDYYPVITARSATGFTVKMLKTAHKHSQGSTSTKSSHTHTFSDTSSSKGGHSHTQGVTGGPSYSENFLLCKSRQQWYCARESGGESTSSFNAYTGIPYSLGVPSPSHYHTNQSTSSVSSHTHYVSGTTGSGGSHSHTNPDTATVNAGNLLASTEVTFSYIAMIP